MTARPVDPESRRRPLCTAVALVLVMVAVLLAAGCMGPGQDNTAAAPPSPTPAIPRSDKEFAEKTIAEAKMQIEKTDVTIGWFRGNASTRDDMQLPTIITKREIALSYLTTAEDEIANGNYQRARDKAQDGYTKANESYTDALRRQQEITGVPGNCGKATPGSLIIIAITVFLVSLLPALLAAFTYSLFKMNIMPGLERFRQYGDRISDAQVFFGAWIIYAALLIIAVVTRQLIRPRISLLGTTISPPSFWAGLVILSMILSVMVLGLVIGGMIRAHQRLNRKESKPMGEAPVNAWQNKGTAGEILAVILLLILVFFAVRFSVTIPGPFVMCL